MVVWRELVLTGGRQGYCGSCQKKNLWVRHERSTGFLNRIDMNVLVTGAARFVGSAVVRSLPGCNHTVVGLVRKSARAVLDSRTRY